MPCFKPSKDYLVKLTNTLINQYQLKEPFLEIGCGDGTFTEIFAKRGWNGTSIDLSDNAVFLTLKKIANFQYSSNIEIKKIDFLKMVEVHEKYNTVIMYDVLEHIREDKLAIKKMKNILKKNGFLLLSFPVKMKEWRWDDDNYGHIRRYEQDAIGKFFNNDGFKVIIQWDITFPVLWAMRRIYTSILKYKQINTSIEQKTEQSAFKSSAGDGVVMKIVESLPIWKLLFWIQSLFKDKNYGCNTVILVQKLSL